MHYDWSLLNSGKCLRNSFTNKVTENFKKVTNYDTSISANVAYNYFETVCCETVKELIPEKTKKSLHKPWENEDIYEKRKLFRNKQKISDSLENNK